MANQPYLGLEFDPTKQIRVLRIQPSSDPNATVHATVFLVTPGDPTHEAYNALSYCWGNPNNRRNIKIAENVMSVTYSLESALRHMRKDSEELSIWADAVCINQEDKYERRVQVMMMGTVYKEAENVLVWLGIADADSDLAMDTCNEWGSRTISSRNYPQRDDSQQDDSPEEMEEMEESTLADEAQGGAGHGNVHEGNTRGDDTQTHNTQEGQVDNVELDNNSPPSPNRGFILSQLVDSSLEQNRPKWEAIQHLLDREYWKRLWIYQEIQLAQKVLIRCGNKEVAWEHFAGLNIASAEIYRKKILLEIEMSGSNRSIVDGSGINRLHMFFDHALTGFKRQDETFYQVLRCTAYQQCGQQEDRMYAILSLSKDGDDYPAPEYEKSVAHIYTQYAKQYIRQTGSLEWLNEASCRKHETPDLANGETRWPSWVPYWKAQPRNEIVLRNYGEVVDWYYSSRLYDAFGGKPVIEAREQDEAEEPNEEEAEGAQAHSETGATTKMKHEEVIDEMAPVIRPLGILYDTISNIETRPFHEMKYRDIVNFVRKGRAPGQWEYYPNQLPLFNVLYRTSLMGIYPVNLGSGTLFPITESAFTTELAQGFLLNVACDFGFLLEIPPDMSGLSLEGGFGRTRVARYVWRTPTTNFDFRFWDEDTMRTAKGEQETSDFFQTPPQNYREFATFQSFVAARRNDSEVERDTTYWFLMHNWRARVRDATKGRTLFRTKSGLIGLATNSSLKHSDWVAVLFGGKTPFVLRQVSTLMDGTFYELVTDAYINGLMEGEAVLRAMQRTPDDTNGPALLQLTIR